MTFGSRINATNYKFVTSLELPKNVDKEVVKNTTNLAIADFFTNF